MLIFIRGEIKIPNNFVKICGSEHSTGKNQLPGVYTKGTLVENGLNKDLSNQPPSLFNLLLTFGIFQNILKTTKITPIHSNYSKLKCSDYRPISVLSNIDKSLERIIYNRLTLSSKKSNLFTFFQYRFR